jgi:hypothetical protein
MNKKRLMCFWIIAVLCCGCMSVPYERYNSDADLDAKIDNPEYKAYCLMIKKKIYSCVHKHYNVNSTGELPLQFTIYRDGRVDDFTIIPGSGNADETLKKIAIEAVNEASPFPPFTGQLQTYSKLKFKLILDFKGTGE